MEGEPRVGGEQGEGKGNGLKGYGWNCSFLVEEAGASLECGAID